MGWVRSNWDPAVETTVEGTVLAAVSEKLCRRLIAGEDVRSVWVNGRGLGSIGETPFVELVCAVFDLDGSRDLCCCL